MAQRLVRTICKHCATRQNVDRQYLLKAGFPQIWDTLAGDNAGWHGMDDFQPFWQQRKIMEAAFRLRYLVCPRCLRGSSPMTPTSPPSPESPRSPPSPESSRYGMTVTSR